MSEEVIVTLISTLGAVAVAAIGFFGVRAGINRAKSRKATNPAIDEDDEALASYETDPAAFVRDLRADNKELREEVRSMREEQTRMWDELKGLRTSLETQKREENRFRDALGRWLVDLFAAWGHTPQMPWPRAGDLEVLKSVLPERT